MTQPTVTTNAPVPAAPIPANAPPLPPGFEWRLNPTTNTYEAYSIAPLPPVFAPSFGAMPPITMPAVPFAPPEASQFPVAAPAAPVPPVAYGAPPPVVASPPPPPPAPAAAEAPARRKRRTKAEMEAARAAEAPTHVEAQFTGPLGGTTIVVAPAPASNGIESVRVIVTWKNGVQLSAPVTQDEYRNVLVEHVIDNSQSVFGDGE